MEEEEEEEEEEASAMCRMGDGHIFLEPFHEMSPWAARLFI